MTDVLGTIRSEAVALLRHVAADRLPVDAGAVAKLNILMGEVFEAGRQSVHDDEVQPWAAIPATRVFTWDYKAQPPLGEILSAARDMPGPWFWFCPETGSQEYALILSGRELNAVEAERILWETVEG